MNGNELNEWNECGMNGIPQSIYLFFIMNGMNGNELNEW